MLAEFYLPRVSNDMKIVIQKNHLTWLKKAYTVITVNTVS